MIYKLVCAGNDSFSKLYQKDTNEVIVAVDGGYNILKNNNIKVNYFFGDKDSLINCVIESDNVFEYNPIKDESDFELVISYLVNNIKISNDDIVIVYNATGGRLDHYQAIINTLIKYDGYKIYILDLNNRIYISDLHMNFRKNKFKYISFFSLDNETIISLTGMKYNLKKYNFKMQDNLCLSNETSECGELITNKKVLVIESN